MIPIRKRFETKSKLIYMVKELREKNKMTQSEIAAELGVSQGTVSVILRECGLGGKLAKRPW